MLIFLLLCLAPAVRRTCSKLSQVEKEVSVFGDKAVLLSCAANSEINVTIASVEEGNTSCIQNQQCVSKTKDFNFIKDSCDGERSCTLYARNLSIYNCLRYGYYNLSYSCKREVSICEFTSGSDWCIYKNEDTNNPQWKIIEDKENSIAHHPYLTCLNRRKYTSVLRSNDIVPSPEQCLYFWLRFTRNAQKLEIEIKSGDKTKSVWNTSTGSTDKWEKQKVQLKHFAKNYTVSFRANCIGSEGGIGLDVISIFNLPCDEPSRNTDGEYHDTPLECKKTPEGSEYKGRINQTKSGILCQSWNLDSPHSHDYNKENYSNFCRNPDSTIQGPWCYTIDENKRYEHCTVPFCEQHKLCQRVDENLSLESCSTYYLIPDGFQIKFDPKINGCSDIYNSIQNLTDIICKDGDYVRKIDMSNLVKKNQECFVVNKLKIKYTCSEMKTSLKPTDTSTDSRSTQTNGRSTTADESNTGIVAGAVTGALVLICIGLVLLVLFKRRSQNQNEKVVKQTHTEDYLGIQKIAMPMKQLKTEKEPTNLNVHENDQVNYAIATDGKDIYGWNSKSPNNTNCNEVEYGIYSCANNSHGSEKKFTNKKNKPYLPSDDVYGVSEDGTYDVSYDRRHKEETNYNIYGHSVDDVYDISSQKRGKTNEEETYDHFFGQQTEDEYDTSKRK